MFRSFAIVPAAGRSVRMGVPKLLLPVAGSTVIARVLAAWTASRVTRTVVVVRADDTALIDCCREFAVDVVTPPSPPAEMRASVQLTLAHVARQYAPADGDAWLLAPADLPRLTAPLIDAVLHAYNPAQPQAIVPTYGGRRGHPLVLPWAAASGVPQLPPGQGINALVASLQPRLWPSAWPEVLDDLNNPADYARLRARTAESSPGFYTHHDQLHDARVIAPCNEVNLIAHP